MINKSHTKTSKVALLLVVIAIASSIATAYLEPGLRSQWTSDDYALVPHLSERPQGSFLSTLTRSENGILTPHRLFLYATVGPFGSTLSTPGVHLFAISAHFICALLTYGFAKRILHCPTTFALIGTLVFAIAPWATQPVLWWSGVCTIISSIFMLISAHLFHASLRSESRRFRLVLVASAIFSSFLSLCFYDLWIAGWLIFIAISWSEKSQHSNSSHAITALQKSLVMALPFAIWIGLVFFIGPRHNMGDRLDIDILRIPIVFASLHARVIHWFVDQNHISLFLEGVSSGRSLTFGFFAFLALTATTACCVLKESSSSIKVDEDNTSKPTLGAKLLIVWSLFLAGRLSMILQGGVALHSRLNYGAAIAFGLGFGSFYYWIHSRSSATTRRILAIAAACLLGSMILITTGRANHYAAVTLAEETTLNLPALKNPPPDQDSPLIIVSGTPVPPIGELNYFSEGPGTWLRWNLEKRWQKPVHVKMLNATETAHGLPDHAIPIVWQDGKISSFKY